MIKFIGKRSAPPKLDHTPTQHPAAPSSLPNSFAAYRLQATEHGPLNKTLSAYNIGGASGSSLGSIEPKKGIFFDRSELGDRFQKIPFTTAEIEAVESGGATMWA